MGGIDIMPLALGHVTPPDWHPRSPAPIPIQASLIRHPDGAILFDTGVGGGHPGIEKLYSPERIELANALANAGVAVGDVVGVVNCHLHFDHCGENSLFPGAPIYVQTAELETSRAPLYTIAEWAQFDGAAYVQIDGETEIARGVRLFPTPGHTAGHQSMLVETDNGLTVLAGQAAYDAAEWTGAAHPMSGEWDDAAYARSLTLLRALSPQRVYFSHDDTIWTKE